MRRPIRAVKTIQTYEKNNYYRDQTKIKVKQSIYLRIFHYKIVFDSLFLDC